MVHMPSHIWFRLGRYEDAALANVAALDADRAYAEKTDAPTPLGKLTYHGHDVSFGLGAAMLSGDADIALKLVGRFDRDFPAADASAAEWTAERAYAAFGRFAAPPAVLDAPDPGGAKPFLAAMRHYARGEAYLRLGQAKEVRAEATRISLPAGLFATPNQSQAVIVKIARLTLEGDADLLDHQPDAAVSAFSEAAGIQESSLGRSYDPPAWWYPVRRSLAAARLANGDAAGAEHEAATVLQTWKLDPVTLAIAASAERLLGRAEAARDEAAARAGWHGDPASLSAAARV
jgi:tetratricopeptide (TPR) repeat protein